MFGCEFVKETLQILRFKTSGGKKTMRRRVGTAEGEIIVFWFCCEPLTSVSWSFNVLSLLLHGVIFCGFFFLVFFLWSF